MSDNEYALLFKLMLDEKSYQEALKEAKVRASKEVITIGIKLDDKQFEQELKKQQNKLARLQNSSRELIGGSFGSQIKTDIAAINTAIGSTTKESGINVNQLSSLFDALRTSISKARAETREFNKAQVEAQKTKDKSAATALRDANYLKSVGVRATALEGKASRVGVGSDEGVNSALANLKKNVSTDTKVVQGLINEVNKKISEAQKVIRDLNAQAKYEESVGRKIYSLESKARAKGLIVGFEENPRDSENDIVRTIANAQSRRPDINNKSLTDSYIVDIKEAIRKAQQVANQNAVKIKLVTDPKEIKKVAGEFKSKLNLVTYKTPDNILSKPDVISKQNEVYDSIVDFEKTGGSVDKIKRKFRELSVEIARAKKEASILAKTEMTPKDINNYENEISQLTNKLLRLEANNRDVIKSNHELAQSYEDAKNEMKGITDAPNNKAQAAGNITGIKKTIDDLSTLTAQTKEAGGAGFTLGEMFGTAFKKFMVWAAVSGVVYEVIGAVKKSIEYVSALDKEITSLRMVTGMSAEEANKMALSYNKLAKELGATTLEVAKGSLEWMRQGKSAEETSTLLRASVMMGKMANIEQAQSTEYMTAVLNGFKLEAQDSMNVVDKLVALDNNYATSVGEIIEAMQRSSNTAREAGVSFNELAAYITVVSSTTRKSADTIGESLKIFVLTKLRLCGIIHNPH